MASKFILRTDGSRDRVQANLVDFLSKLPANKSWTVEIKQFRKERSNEQNAALFGVAYQYFAPLGFTPDDIHEFMCMRFFGTVEREFMGQVVLKPFRTTTRNERGERDVLDSKTFSMFYQAVQQAGAEAGIYVPDPDSCPHSSC